MYEEVGGDPRIYDDAGYIANGGYDTSFGDVSMNLGTAAWVLGYDKSKGRDEDKDTLSNLLGGQLLASLEDPVQGAFMAAAYLRKLTPNTGNWSNSTALNAASGYDNGGNGPSSYGRRVMKNRSMLEGLLK
ncbi:hypothetical protein [Herbidospora daliensis]|uniref:hypothetical protein n=1 Tax=Herbidospora daliensis TaxID=295585 RepID=UPI0012F89FA3|nr:hypothetical protein [Herbidospora daliensis]